MAQRRFWNWQDEDSTFELSRWRIGLIDAGLYRGFDPDVFGANMSLKLIHSPSGAFRTNIDRTLSNQFGVVSTKQGVIVQEDEAITLAINPSSTARVDIVVLEHEYMEITGGTDAIYKVIQGISNTPPNLTNPNIQVILGYLYLPANCTSLNQAGVKYVKSKAPAFANAVDFIEKENGFFLTNLDARDNRIINLANPVNNQDAATKYYVDQAIANNVQFATETNRGIIEIATDAETQGGSDDLRAVTPLKAKNLLDARTASQTEANADTDQTKFITPKTLGNRTATENRKGVIAIATQQEVADGVDDTKAVTPFKLKQFLGLRQEVVELGAWDMANVMVKNIAHTFDWWNKVVAMAVTIVGDDGIRYMYDAANSTQVSANISATTIVVNSDLSGNPDFNATGFNRGYVVFWIKNDIVQPPSSITVNAGPDQSFTRLFLSYGTPVLRKINNVGSSPTYGAHSANGDFFKIKLTIENGAGTNLGTCRLYYKKQSDANWYSDGSSVYNGDEVEVLFTNVMSQGEPLQFRLGVYVNGTTQEIFSNTLTIIYDELNSATEVQGYTPNQWQDTAATSQVTPFTVNLAGYAESIGSPLNGLAWSVVSGPANAVYSFGNANALNTTFVTDTFGTYVLRLSANNANGDTAQDDMVVNLVQQLNAPPIAAARWGDNTIAPKNVAWQVSNPYIGAWYGYYGAQLTGSYSSDPDGYIVGYYWQYNLNGAGWTDLDATSSSFPNMPSPSKLIQTDGNWKFRVKVRDNFGLDSAWSNELVLDITGSNLVGNPLNVFQLQILSGGFGYYNTTAQLSISPTTGVHKLVAKTQSYTNASGNVMTNDFFLKIQGNGILQYNTPAVGTERDITSIMSNNMTIWVDLNNIPPAKSVQVDFIAYDANNAVIGTRTIQMGNTGTAIAYVANGDSMSFPINVTSNKKVKVIVNGIVNMNPGWHVVLANGLNPASEMYDLVSNETKIFNLVLVPGNTYYLMSNSIQGPTGTSATVELIDA